MQISTEIKFDGAKWAIRTVCASEDSNECFRQFANAVIDMAFNEKMSQLCYDKYSVDECVKALGISPKIDSIRVKIDY